MCWKKLLDTTNTRNSIKVRYHVFVYAFLSANLTYILHSVWTASLVLSLVSFTSPAIALNLAT